MSGHPYWPAKLASEEEKKKMETQLKKANFTLADDFESAKETEYVVMYFLGSHTYGMVRRMDIDPYVFKYKEHRGKNSSKSFQLGLEEAESEVLLEYNKDGTNGCFVCGGDEDPTKIVICDRCNGEVHFSCCVPAISSLPDGDFYCHLCMEEVRKKERKKNEIDERKKKIYIYKAPLSYAESKALHKQKKKEEENGKQEPEERERKKEGSRWDAVEDEKLLNLIAIHGQKWVIICRHLPGRTEYSCVNRFQKLKNYGKEIPSKKEREKKKSDDG